jgi:hypothetical protein
MIISGEKTSKLNIYINGLIFSSNVDWNAVPVDYTLLVEVLQTQQDLGGVEARPLLAERLVPLQEIEHLA